MQANYKVNFDVHGEERASSCSAYVSKLTDYPGPRMTPEAVRRRALSDG
jgi:hypothetical protein